VSLREIRHFDWKITVNEQASAKLNLQSSSDIDQLLTRLTKPDEILKQDHRSEVGLVTIGEVKYVIKKFTIQENWFWFQMTSLLFPTVGEIAFRNGIGLSESNIETPTPSLLLQQKKWGSIVKSWLVYPFMEGSSLSLSDGKSMVRFVKSMHTKGWIHRDPHPANFIRTTDCIATIDPIKARKRGGRYLMAYDIVLLSHDIPTAAEIYGKDELGLWWNIATFGHQLIRIYRAIKHSIRSAFRISNA